MANTTRIEKPCQQCGKVMRLYPSANRRKYCSRVCMGLAERNPDTFSQVTCSYCQVMFQKRTDHIGERNYCSPDCNHAARRNADAKWNNPDYIKSYMAQYVQANKEKHNERGRNWAHNNPEKRRASIERRRARVRNAGGSYSAADIKRQYGLQKGKCYYCHCKLNGKYDVDHVVPLSRGGSNDASNIVLACSSCNNAKRAKLPHEWPEGGRLI